MSFDERRKYMATVVYPQMAEAFAGFAPSEYTGEGEDGQPKFGCDTCHGENMKAVKFKMPNTLRPLSAPNPIPGAMEYDAHMTEFMLKVVSPKMAELLGRPQASAEHPDGFGCFGCHQKE